MYSRILAAPLLHVKFCEKLRQVFVVSVSCALPLPTAGCEPVGSRVHCSTWGLAELQAEGSPDQPPWKS